MLLRKLAGSSSVPTHPSPFVVFSNPATQTQWYPPTSLTHSAFLPHMSGSSSHSFLSTQDSFWKKTKELELVFLTEGDWSLSDCAGYFQTSPDVWKRVMHWQQNASSMDDNYQKQRSVLEERTDALNKSGKLCVRPNNLSSVFSEAWPRFVPCLLDHIP